MSKVALARWCSIVGHPLTFVVLLVGTASWRLYGGYNAVRTTGVVVTVILLPLSLFVWNRYSSGRWETVDASAPADRPALYAVAFLLLIPLGLYFLVGERAKEMVKGVASVALLIAVAAAANRWIKLSVHVAIATFAAIIITKLMPSFGAILLAFLPILAWSRLKLSRHSLVEVLGGFVLGLTIGAATAWI